MRGSVVFLFSFLFALRSVAQCDDFELNLTFTNPTCPGYCDAGISGVVVGYNTGVNVVMTDESGAIYMDPWATGTCPNCLCPGWYFFYAVDSADCELNDSIYVPDVDEMQVVMNISLPSEIDSCNGYVVIDTVLNYGGSYDNLSFFWNPGGPDGVGQDSLSDVCFGEYTLTLNNELGCGVVVDFIVGNLELLSLSDNEILIYPIPFNDHLNIQSSEKINSVIIFDLNGRVIYEEFNPEGISEIPLNHVESGTYFLELNFLNSQKVYKRILKY